MSTVRFAALLATPSAPATTVPVEPLPAVQSSAATIAPGGLFTRASRGRPPRRALLWISDLTGEQIGVIS